MYGSDSDEKKELAFRPSNNAAQCARKELMAFHELRRSSLEGALALRLRDAQVVAAVDLGAGNCDLVMNRALDGFIAG